MIGWLLGILVRLLQSANGWLTIGVFVDHPSKVHCTKAIRASTPSLAYDVGFFSRPVGQIVL